MFQRRTFLKGMSLGTSGVLLSPFLRHLSASTTGKPVISPRFVFFVEGNGLPPKHLQPSTIPYIKREDRQQFTEVSLEKHALPTSLAPLEKYKQTVTILHGLSGRVTQGGHSTYYGALGAYHSRGIGPSAARAQTIDAALGQAHPGILPMISLGITMNPEATVKHNCSVALPGQPVPCLMWPEHAYKSLFGVVAQGEGRKEFTAKKHLIDYMADDVKRVRKQLNNVGRWQLDQYLSAFESLGDRQQRLIETRDRLSKFAPIPNDKYQSTVETDRLDAHVDIATAALLGGITNVVTLCSAVGDYDFNITFRGLGIDVPKHHIGHGGSWNGMTADQMATKIRNFEFGLMARMMDRLASVPEGNGSMLDNTLFVYLSDAPETHHSLGWEWPMVMIGDLNGRLKSPGRLLNFPNYGRKGHRTINNLYNTLLHAAGVPKDDFGEKDPMLKDLDQNGPLPELLA